MLHHAPRLCPQADLGDCGRPELEQRDAECASCDREQPGYLVRRLARLLAHHRERVGHDFRQVRGQRHERTGHLHPAEKEQGQQQQTAAGGAAIRHGAYYVPN